MQVSLKSKRPLEGVKSKKVEDAPVVEEAAKAETKSETEAETKADDSKE